MIRLPAVPAPRFMCRLRVSDAELNASLHVTPNFERASAPCPAMDAWHWGKHSAAVVQARARGDEEKARKLSLLSFAFREFDYNRDGVLSKRELQNSLAQLKLPSEDADVIKLFTVLDTNHDDTLQLEEWLDFLPSAVADKLEEFAGARMQCFCGA